MDLRFQDQLNKNVFNYKTSLERIIDKYSKLQYLHGAMEVDLDETDLPELERCMKLSKKELSSLESKSVADLREESLQAQDVTQGSQLDSMNQDETTSQLSSEDPETSRSDSVLLTGSSLNRSERTCSEADLQPEDQDQDLEMSLRSRGTLLVNLYPSMISQIGKAQHRQHVSEAAGSVVRRYRRWRRLSSRGSLNGTFNITPRNTGKNPKRRTSTTTLAEASCSPLRGQFPGFYSRREETEPAPQSPSRQVTRLHSWRPQPCSPGRERGSLSRERHQPVLVMDFSCPFEISKPESVKLNETFVVTRCSPPSSSQPRERPSCRYAVSPPRRYSPSAKASLDPSLRSKRLSLSAHTAGGSVYAPESTAAREAADIYRSPARESPLKANMMRMMRESLMRSPYAISRSPKLDCGGSLPRPNMSSRSQSSVLSVPPRMPRAQDSQHSPRSRVHSPLPRRHNLRRHLSFDSSLLSGRTSYSQKDLDDVFANLYHKFVCQKQSSPLNGAPCQKCERGAEVSRRHSSQTLMALALSPHRIFQKKRLRELDWENHPQSKRSREADCTNSPGSKRHMKELLRRRLCPPEPRPRHDGLHRCHRKYGAHERLNITQPSACAVQPQGWHGPSAGLRDSHERKMAAGYFPR